MELMDRLKAGFERIEASGGELGALEADSMTLIDQVKQHVAQNPEPVFAVLRRVKPIFLHKNTALVSRFEDVQEVLSRDDVFQVTYKEKMEVIGGGTNFFLGMQNSPEYERDLAHMRSVMRREDLTGRIIPFVAKTAEGIVSAANGRMEVVSQLTRVVPTRLVINYFGCTPPSEEELAAWATAMFQYLFTDVKNDPVVGSAARDAATTARTMLEQSIAQHKSQPSQADDIITRCLALQKAALPNMDDAGIRSNLLGLLIGAIPTTSKCCAQALDELLKRPQALAEAQQAAQADNDALVAQYVFEALRFNPNNPGVVRIAAEDYTVAKSTMRATTIPKGATVVALTQSAMFDEKTIDSPNDFRPGRPAYNYMHYGYALHTCFGQYINQAQIPGILKPLLKRKNLRRADGDSGKLQYTGPFPSSLSVAFD
jgi:cytochrome P450